MSISSRPNATAAGTLQCATRMFASATITAARVVSIIFCRICLEVAISANAARAGLISLLAPDKTIAHADDGFNAGAAFVELLPEAADVDVKRSRVAEIAVAPDVVE